MMNRVITTCKTEGPGGRIDEPYFRPPVLRRGQPLASLPAVSYSSTLRVPLAARGRSSGLAGFSSLVWPILWMRSIACSSTAGFL